MTAETTTQPKRITPRDILPMDAYADQRKARRAKMTALKRNRRVEVGPYCAFYFESYDTMLHQVHEMLFVERGGAAQIADELAAYNPLIPQGRELVATVMFELDDAARRSAALARLGGVEHAMFINIGDETIRGVAEDDIDRTTAAGKASAIQFVHFPFTDAQARAFRTPGAQVVIGLDHDNYAHMAVAPEAVRAALAQDFDP